MSRRRNFTLYQGFDFIDFNARVILLGHLQVKGELHGNIDVSGEDNRDCSFSDHEGLC